jgi:hypothetical protein
MDAFQTFLLFDMSPENFYKYGTIIFLVYLGEFASVLLYILNKLFVISSCFKITVA